jgi:hypothetical protein
MQHTTKNVSHAHYQKPFQHLRIFMLCVKSSHARHQVVLIDFVIKTLKINPRTPSPMASCRCSDARLPKSFVTKDVTGRANGWCSRGLQRALSPRMAPSCAHDDVLEDFQRALLPSVSPWRADICYSRKHRHLDILALLGLLGVIDETVASVHTKFGPSLRRARFCTTLKTFLSFFSPSYKLFRMLSLQR